jgi:hypothetical protein
MIDYDKVAVPRRVLYLQGALLAVVALLSFVLGLLVGGGQPQDSAEAGGRPCLLSGQVTYGGPEQSRPDHGSVVIVLPVDRRPDVNSRVAVEGLRPRDPIPAEGNLSLRTIRSLGGDSARTNEDGSYQVRLPEKGRYHVLVISRRAARSGNDSLEVADVAQIGRYFANAIDLLDDRQYQWRTVTLQGNMTLDTTF